MIQDLMAGGLEHIPHLDNRCLTYFKGWEHPNCVNKLLVGQESRLFTQGQTGCLFHKKIVFDIKILPQRTRSHSQRMPC